MTKDYKITLTPRDFTERGAKPSIDAPFASSGQLYDLLAIASRHSEINDIEGDNLEMYDAAIDYVLKHYDWERAYIDALNRSEDGVLVALLGLDHLDDLAALVDPKSNLMAGAYVALNHPRELADGLKAWKASVEDAAHECLGGYDERKGLPLDLAKELDEAYASVGDDMMKEYLNGDPRGNWNGVYMEAKRALFRDIDSLDFHQNDDDRRKNALHVDVDELDGRQIVADYEGCDLTKARIGSDRVKRAIAFTILYAAKNAVEERRRKAEARRAEREKTEAYQKEQREKAEAERRAKLLAMKK